MDASGMNGYQLLWSLLKHVLLGRGRAPVYIVLSPFDDHELEDAAAQDNWVVEYIDYQRSDDMLVVNTIEEE